MLTIIMQALILVFVCIGFNKVIGMTDPNISSYQRMLEEEEVQEIDEIGVNFADFDFNIGILVSVISWKT